MQELAVFNLISLLKNIDKKIIYENKLNDEIYINSSYINMKNIISLRKWRKIIHRYSEETGKSIYDSVMDLHDPIIDEFKDLNLKHIYKDINKKDK